MICFCDLRRAKGSPLLCCQYLPICTAIKKLYHGLLLSIASSTQKELARHVRYLKIENQILRPKLLKRAPLTDLERSRLVRFGAKLGKALGELVTIVHPATPRRI